jgi:NhaP-type Na+/H+ or K+/H+ antiporter
MYEYLFLFAVLIFLYSIFASRIERMLINGPLLFMVAGIILGPLVLNAVDLKISGAEYETLANLALALVLFTGAASVDLEVLKSSVTIPARLLFIGLPLTIISGFIAGYFIFNDLLIIELAILATVLAPTDAALGEAVVKDQVVPAKVRNALNVESGLNDGISVPVFLLLLAFLKVHTIDEVTWQFGLGLFAKEIGIGLAVGSVVMYLGARLLLFAEVRKWIGTAWKPVIVVTLALSCFSLADILGGSGFIACFTGGFIYGAINKKYKSNLQEHAEGLGNVLTFLIWIIFGSFVISTYFRDFTWLVMLYALISLTLVRIVPVMIALTRSKVTLKEKLFIGWFGPRGLASIVFAVMLLDAHLPRENTVILTIICTVMLSVILHGITANPLVNSFKTKNTE